MALTRLEMASELLDNIGRLGSSTTRSGATMSTMSVTWLNRAQTQIARRYDMLFKISTASTVASTKDYALPSNVRCVFSHRLEDGLNSRRLIPLMPWEFDRVYPKPNEITTGRPDFYIPYKTTNTFELFRIPDATYTLRMRHSVWPSALSADGSTSDYQTSGIDLDDAIISLGTSFGFKYLQELVDSATWKKEALEEARRVWLEESSSFPDWVPVGRGFTGAESSIAGEYYNDPLVWSDV